MTESRGLLRPKLGWLAALLPCVACAGSTEAAPPPKPVQIAASTYETWAAMSDGSVKCWGAIWDWASSHPPTTLARPMAVFPLKHVARVAPNDSLGGCALLSDATVSCWGNDRFGGRGDGVATEEPPYDPVHVPGLSTVAQVTSGNAYSCARLDKGTVECWGSNESGEVGAGILSEAEPSPSVVPNLTDVTDVSTGFNVTCAVTTDANVRCWGHDPLGLGTTDDWLIPTPLKDVTGATQVSVGYDVCVLEDNGHVACLNQDPTREALIDVPGVSGVKEVRVSNFTGMHDCALLLDGTVECWGNNDRGQLGDGTTITRSEPQPVPGLSDVVGLALGYAHSCALTANATVLCWGANDKGQLGDGTTEDRTTPTLVAF